MDKERSSVPKKGGIFRELVPCWLLLFMLEFTRALCVPCLGTAGPSSSGAVAKFVPKSLLQEDE